MIDFVGAGPGAPDLITKRGAELLAKADLVIYAGSLVNPALLGLTKPGCRILNSAEMTLPQVVEELALAEAAGLRSVRLHTGDPSLYGAIREQLDELAGRGISCRVTPGVSSFCAAAASLGAEYTLPAVSQTVIITRMAGRTPVPPGQDIAGLAAHGATMVIFLSAGMLPRLTEELLKGAYTPHTPAALVYKASWPEEKLLRCRLADLAETGKQAGVSRTALVLVGDFLKESGYEKSCLYDPAFTTGYRKGEPCGSN